MKIAIIGMGSMGKRHRLLIQKNFPDIKSVPIHHDQLDKVDGTFDAAFICTPTDTHVPIATEMARRGLHLFIEKPLSTKVDGIPDLIRECIHNRVTAYVAYPLRFASLARAFVINSLLDHEYDLWSKGGHSLTFVCRTDAKKWPSKRILDHVLFELSHEVDLSVHCGGWVKHITGVWTDKKAWLAVTHRKDVLSNIILDMESDVEERYFVFNDRRHNYQVNDVIYISQLEYFFDNIDNPHLMNNIYDAFRLIAIICALLDRGEK